jgi:hypothetical protein
LNPVQYRDAVFIDLDIDEASIQGFTNDHLRRSTHLLIYVTKNNSGKAAQPSPQRGGDQWGLG